MKVVSLLTLVFLFLTFFSNHLIAQTIKVNMDPVKLQRLKVSDNKRFLIYADGKPFFYLGDTAWELFHRLTVEEAELYFEDRREKGFTVIQAVALAELDGLHTPNAYHHKPLKNDDPTQPDEDYFKDMDAFIKLAAGKGLYIGLLPTWGDKVFKDTWGTGPEIFNVENARQYGFFLGNRYKNQTNIIWILGGDRNPRDANDVAVWRSLAEGITSGAGGEDKALMTFHPQPKEDGGSSTWFQNDTWLDFNMLQTGHCKNGTNYNKITHDYELKQVKPVMDGEPLYEDHPVCFDWKKNSFSSADDIRKLAYWQLFAGAFGHTYGCHDVWQFFAPGRIPISSARTHWKEALDLPGAQQMGYVKKLMLSQSVPDRIPDQGLIINENLKDSAYCVATRAADGHYAFIYTPTGRNLEVNTENLKGRNFSIQWFNPRNGEFSTPVKIVKQLTLILSPPVNGEGKDWVLVLTAIP
ncbi:MAG: glycoside hydrolase family 140 protein [Sphingobacteriaceae bacterium]